ncbi:MAG TPA: hypothetical protein VF255_09495 [Solirubrobacterales bacterium]
MSWRRRKHAPSPATPPPGSQRLEALAREYEQLRQDDRSYPAVMVGMASAAAVIGGTSVFFLIRGCGMGITGDCTTYPAEIYMLLPAPSLAVTALLVQQAVGATIRGRLLMAIEVALSEELGQTYRLGSHQVPVHSTYHLQQRVHHDFSGAALWTIMFSLPLLLLIGIIYYSGLEIYGLERTIFYLVYASLVLLIAWTALPVLGSYKRIDSTLGEYLERRRAEGKFQI